MDVEVVGGATAGTSEPIVMEEAEELLAARLLIHKINDREVHEGDSEAMKINWPEGEETRFSPG